MKNPVYSKSGGARLWAACRYSWRGLRQAFTREAAFRQELALVALLAPLALLLPLPAMHRAALLASLLLLLIVELLNSAIEAAIDRISPEPHELSGYAKDAASAAVLLAVGVLLLVWATALWSLWPACCG